MTQKPEWFEMVDGDDQVSDFVKASKRSKSLPITAVIASAAIIIGGAFFANANDESPAVAETVSAPSAQTNTTTPTDSSAAPIAPKSPGKSGIQNPSAKGGDTPAIGQPPQRGEREDDDEFGDDGDRPRFDGDHEGEHDGNRLPPPDGFRGRHHGTEVPSSISTLDN